MSYLVVVNELRSHQSSIAVTGAGQGEGLVL